MHGGGKGIVGRLASVHVVIRVAQRRAQKFIGAVGNNLVGVHIGLRAGTGLPDNQREMGVQPSRRHFRRGLFDGPEFVRRHLFGQQGMICPRGGPFQNAKSVYDFQRHGLYPNANAEIPAAAFRLSGPVHLRRYLDFPHRVVFRPIIHKSALLCAAAFVRCHG